MNLFTSSFNGLHVLLDFLAHIPRTLCVLQYAPLGVQTGVDYPDLKTEMEIGLARLRILLEGSCIWM